MKPVAYQSKTEDDEVLVIADLDDPENRHVQSPDAVDLTEYR